MIFGVFACKAHDDWSWASIYKAIITVGFLDHFFCSDGLLILSQAKATIPLFLMLQMQNHTS